MFETEWKVHVGQAGDRGVQWEVAQEILAPEVRGEGKVKHMGVLFSSGAGARAVG